MDRGMSLLPLESHTMRLLESITGTAPDTAGNTHTFTTKVYRDSEWREWRVKFFVNGIHQVNADYHTSDKADAQGMARSAGWRKAYAA